MNYQDILYNILASSTIIGIATYLIQKHIDKRFNKIEEFQKTLITIRKERYDTLLKTLQEIWEKIIETEYYIRHDIPQQYIKAQQEQHEHITFDSTPLKNTFIFIEKRSILLEESLSNKISVFFIEYFQNTYNEFINVLNQVPNGQMTLDDVNQFIPKSLGQQYKTELDALRKEFERQAREILYDNDKTL